MMACGDTKILLALLVLAALLTCSEVMSMCCYLYYLFSAKNVLSSTLL